MFNVEICTGMGNIADDGNPAESMGMDTVVVGIPRGWN